MHALAPLLFLALGMYTYGTVAGPYGRFHMVGSQILTFLCVLISFQWKGGTIAELQRGTVYWVEFNGDRAFYQTAALLLILLMHLLMWLELSQQKLNAEDTSTAEAGLLMLVIADTLFILFAIFV